MVMIVGPMPHSYPTFWDATKVDYSPSLDFRSSSRYVMSEIAPHIRYVPGSYAVQDPGSHVLHGAAGR